MYAALFQDTQAEGVGGENWRKLKAGFLFCDPTRGRKAISRALARGPVQGQPPITQEG
ncbi:hypothetical protein SAMN04488523_12910 [Sulfitobacter brevis]|uniref:Uncharacterized protein n=1 Tax=Sulfitobacter brevis TaxID=74348 RepID=A0A1I2GTY1_9RHOB|nr:hypothetical protein SAMN04488523_12910 [Sulfitobacter brevis]